MSGTDSNQPDEAILLKKARKFDEGALTSVYEAYHDAIYRYIYHHIGEAQTAQDLAADVFRRFLQALRSGGGPTRQLGAWLYRVAHNLIVDELRRRKHRDHASLDDGLGENLRVDSENLDELAGRAMATERVRRALLELTDEQRQVVVLKFLEGMGNAEVADITGKTVGAVKALQHRGLDTLRMQLVASEIPILATSPPRKAAIPSGGS